MVREEPEALPLNVTTTFGTVAGLEQKETPPEIVTVGMGVGVGVGVGVTVAVAVGVGAGVGVDVGIAHPRIWNTWSGTPGSIPHMVLLIPHVRQPLAKPPPGFCHTAGELKKPG